jgi:Ca2+-binding EF-hand superfamily protein
MKKTNSTHWILVLGAIVFCTGNLSAQQEQRTPPSPEELIKQADKNEDGQISMDEADRMLKRDFKRLDSNKDGQLSLEELKAGKTNARSQQGRQGQRPSTEQIFADLDSDQDGKLSKKEARGPLKQHFDKIDTDEDGFITKEELEKAPKPRRGQGGQRRQ